MSFDPNIATVFKGEITSVDIVEPSGAPPPGTQPNLVIDPTQDFKIEVEWKTYEWLGVWLPQASAALNGSRWEVIAYAESMGPGPEIQIGQAKVDPRNPGPQQPGPLGTGIWNATINVGAGTLPERDPGDTSSGGGQPKTSGVYKLVVTVFLNDKTPFHVDIMGFDEGKIIMVEHAL